MTQCVMIVKAGISVLEKIARPLAGKLLEIAIQQNAVKFYLTTLRTVL